MSVDNKEGSQRGVYQAERLLNVALEYLKTPLIEISSIAERAGKNNSIAAIQSSTQAALEMINALINASSKTPLTFEPVSVKSILHETANELNDLANNYSCQLVIDYSGKSVPIVADQTALKTALTCLGTEFIIAGDSGGRSKKVVTLGAHRTPKGILTGVFTENDDVTQEVFQRGKKLHGRAKMPFAPATNSPGLGIFIADLLLANMSVRLESVKHNHLRGLAANFLPSKQMALI